MLNGLSYLVINDFTVLSRAISRKHLEVLESVYIHVQRPVLCVQKQFVTPLHLLR